MLGLTPEKQVGEDLANFEDIGFKERPPIRSICHVLHVAMDMDHKTPRRRFVSSVSSRQRHLVSLLPCL